MTPRHGLIALVGALLVGLGLHGAFAMQTEAVGCAGLLPTRLIVRERARVAEDDPAPLNIRTGAGTGFERIERIENGGVFYVLSGAVCTSNYTWYEVDYRGVIGWVAEGDDTAYYVEPYPPGQ